MVILVSLPIDIDEGKFEIGFVKRVLFCELFKPLLLEQFFFSEMQINEWI